MQKTVVINGREHTFAPITVDQAEQIQLGSKKGMEYNKSLILASLKAGGDTATTLKDIGATSYFNAAENSFNEWLAPALEVNGLKLAGEAQPAGPAAEEDSTLNTSTDPSADGSATK